MNILKKIRNLRFPKLRRRTHKQHLWTLGVGGLVLGLVATLAIVKLMYPNLTQAAWWDTNWSFRQKVPVSNSSGSTQTDFQVQLTIDTATLITNSKLQSDCDDLRFTAQNGKVLSYWLEPNTCNTTTTLVWIKVPNIPTSGADVYYYYGNPTASSESTTAKTFIQEINGAAAAWPLDDTTTTQSYSRVTNPAVSTGRELVTNGGFDTDTIWTKGTGWTIASGVAHAANITDSNLSLTPFPVTIGRVYQFTYTISNYSAGTFRVYVGNSNVTVSSTANGTYTQTIIAAGTGNQILVRASGGATADIDNVSVTELNIPASSGSATELLTDGTMEGADTSSWTVVNTATLSKQTTSPHGGSQVMRVVRNGSNTPLARQTILTAGNVYRATGYARSDGTGVPIMRHSLTTVFTGTTSTSWQAFDVVFVATSTQFEIGSNATTGTPYVEFDDVTVTLDTNIRPGELVQDGTMEASGTGVWLAGNTATITKDTTSPHGGTQNLRVARNGVNNPQATQAILVTGKTYRITGYAKSDGNASPRVQDGSLTFWTGTTSTSWQLIDATVIATASDGILRLVAITGTGTQYAEFDDISVTEIDPLVGLPTNGVTLGSTANGHLTNGYTFDGTNDLVNIYSTDLNSVFNQSEGTAIVWAKVSGSGVWTDGTSRYIIGLSDGSNNFVVLRKSTISNTLIFNYGAAGTVSAVSAGSISSTGWMQVAITWSKSSDQVKAYINGAQTGSTQTGLGTWSGNFSNSATIIGASSTGGANPWSGMINDVRLYTRALSASEIAAQYDANTDIQAYNSSNYLSKELLRKYNAGVTVGTFGTEEVGADPVAYWKLDDGTGQTVRDTSVNNNTGTLGATSGSSTDDPTWTTEDQCVSSKCLTFDGTNDFVNVPDATSIEPTTAISIGMWFKGNNLGRYAGNTSAMQILARKTNNYILYVYDSTGSQNNLDFFLYGPNARLSYPISNLSNNQWYYAEATYDGTTQKLYINGKLVASQNASGAIGTSSNSLGIGGHSTVGSSFFTGFIDEPKIYNYARSAAQVREDFNRGAASLGTKNQTFLSNGLITYLKFDENTGTTAADSSGNSRTATLTGTAGWRVGKFGAGLDTIGSSNSHAYVADNSDYDNMTQVTWSTWAYIDASTGSTQYLLSRFGTSGSGENYLILSSGLVPAFRIVVGSTEHTATAVSAVTAAAWHHFSGTYDGETIRLYVDGALVATNETPSGNVNMSTATCLGIGGRTSNSADCTISTNPLNGAFDDVRIYNRALPEAEVRALANFAPGPVGYWKMDEGSWNGTSGDVLDSSGNSNSGTSAGSAAITDGKLGNAGSFNGSTGKVTIGDPASGVLDFATGSFSYGMWVYANTNIGASDMAWYKGGGANAVAGYDFELGSGNWFADISDGTTQKNVSFGSGTTGQWEHIMAVIDRNTNKFYAYRNGVLVGSGTDITGEGSTSNAVSAVIGSLGSSAFFNGSIDDVKIYNYARTPAQILEDMGGDPPPSVGGNVLPEPVEYLKFNEQQGQTTNNSGIGGGVLNGVLGTTSGVAANDPTWKTKENCKAEGCLSYDGSDLVTVTHNTALNHAGDFAISAWIYPTLNNVNVGIVNKIENSTNVGYRFLLRSNGTIWCDVGTQSVSTGSKDTVTYDTNQWQHFVCARVGAVMNVYKNGKLVHSTTTSSSAITTTSDMQIGSGGGGNITGFIDDLKIYNTSLTIDQVQLDMNAGASLNFGTTANSEASNTFDGAGTAPVLYWGMDEKGGTSTFDKGTAKLTGTLSGSTLPNWISGKVGAALNFDGANSYISATGTTFSSALTFNAWFYKRNSTYELLAGGASSNEQIAVEPSTSTVTFRNSAGGTTNVTLTGTIPLNTWQYLTITRDSSNNVKAYINGVNRTSGTFTNSGTHTVNNIGMRSDLVTSQAWDGYIDEVKVYDYARTQSQIAYDYNRGLPVAHWKLDECQGSTVNDSSGFGYIGTLTLGAGTQTSAGTCATSGTAWGNGSSGKFSGSLNFDGTDDYVEITSPTTMLQGNSNNYSISAWFKTTSSVAQRIFTEASSSSTTPLINLDINRFNTGDIALEHRDDAGNLRTIATGTTRGGLTAIDGNWHLATMVRESSSTFSLYYDGKLVQTTTTAVIPGTTTTNRVCLGARCTTTITTFLSGQLDDARVYNYALSAKQVNQLYAGGSARFQ